tara:strand:+ start:654 stop:3341 length:2688 start_codon:yes stop_codon:yes gene_type:complete
MGRFITKIDKENKFVTVTDTKTGKKITERYHDGRPAKVAANEMEQDLLLPERRPPASDERQTAMSLMGIASPQSQIKMDNAMFLSDQAMKSPTGNAAISPRERAKVGTTQSLSQPAPSGESIKDRPEMGAEMSSKLAMDALRNRQKKINKESSNAPVSAKALGDYSGLSEDEIKKHEASQNPPWQKARNVLGEKQGFMDRLEENERNQAQKVAGLKKIYDEADPEEQEYIENSPSLGGSEKLDFLKDLGGESVGSGPEWGNPYEGGEAVSSTSVTRNEKGQILGNRGRSSHRGGPNKAQIGEMLYDQGFGGEAVSSSTSPYLEHGKGEAPSEEQLKKAGRNPAHSMFNTPEEYERLAKEEASFLKELGGESISPDEVATLQVEERKSWDADPSTLEETTLKFDAEKPVPKRIAELPREAKTAAKEANGTHVRDEATGFTLNLSRLKKSFKRQERFAMLKHVPKENRAAMLYEWGYIDPDELTVAQKKSAKDLLQLENWRLDIEKKKLDIKKLKEPAEEALSPFNKEKYGAITQAFNQAQRDGNFELMKQLSAEAQTIDPRLGYGKIDYAKLEKQKIAADKKADKNDPLGLALAKSMGLANNSIYVSYSAKLNGQLAQAVSSGDMNSSIEMFDPSGKEPAAKVTLGNFLKNNGIPTWKDVERFRGANNAESVDLAKRMKIKPSELSKLTEYDYKNWAVSNVRNKILTDTFGQRYHRGMQSLMDGRVQKLQQTVNNPKAKEEEINKKSSLDPNPIMSLVDMTEPESDLDLGEIELQTEVANKLQSVKDTILGPGKETLDAKTEQKFLKEGENELKARVSGDGFWAELLPAMWGGRENKVGGAGAPRWKGMNDFFNHLRQNPSKLDDLTKKEKLYVLNYLHKNPQPVYTTPNLPAAPN